MAWRDSRRSRGRLLVFSTALTLGVAALVAIGSVGWNLQRAITDQARTLVGADLIVEARHPLDADAERVRRLARRDRRAQRNPARFDDAFPNTDGSRLTQIRALEGDYPFYGKIETAPPEAAAAVSAPARARCWRKASCLQYGATSATTRSASAARRSHSRRGHETARRGQRVCQHRPARAHRPRSRLPAALTARGSIVRYFTYLKLPAGGARAHAGGDAQRRIQEIRCSKPTPSRTGSGSWGGCSTDVNHFLNLVSFVALLLGRHRRGQRDPRAPQDKAAHGGRAAVPGGVVAANAGDLSDPGARAGSGRAAGRRGGGAGVAERRAAVSEGACCRWICASGSRGRRWAKGSASGF